MAQGFIALRRRFVIVLFKGTLPALEDSALKLPVRAAGEAGCFAWRRAQWRDARFPRIALQPGPETTIMVIRQATAEGYTLRPVRLIFDPVLSWATQPATVHTEMIGVAMQEMEADFALRLSVTRFWRGVSS